MKNYFNTLNFRERLKELKKCRFMKKHEFLQGIKYLKNKKIVIVGCGSQGLNQGLNMRDSGLDVAFALRPNSIKEKRKSWIQAKENKFPVGNYLDLIPTADLVINLTPDKEHSVVVKELQPLMKINSILGYSHGFNIVETGEKIRKDITVIMVAPKCPGTEVREEYKRGFGVPTLIAVHKENDCKNQGLNIAKSWAVSLGSDKAGVLESSFIAEVKSDLMGEQTVLCGLLQAASLVLYQYLINKKCDPIYSGKLIQDGWEVICESLKLGGITLMLDRLSNSSKLRALQLSDQLKKIFSPLFKKHMDDILSGQFSKQLINDWENRNFNLLKWRKEIQCSEFEKSGKFYCNLPKENVFKHGTLMVAFIKAGVELAFETMIESGIVAESAYYESLHELPLIANTISRKRLYEMNIVISDTAEFGSYLFTKSALPILEKFMLSINDTDIGKTIIEQYIDDKTLYNVNSSIRNHPIEIIGLKLRRYMENCKINSKNNNF